VVVVALRPQPLERIIGGLRRRYSGRKGIVACAGAVYTIRRVDVFGATVVTGDSVIEFTAERLRLRGDKEPVVLWNRK
jgi:hypothetical protein